MMKEKFVKGQRVYFFNGGIVSKATVVRSDTRSSDDIPYYLVQLEFENGECRETCRESRLFSDVQLLRGAIANHICYLQTSAEVAIHEAASWIDKG